MTPAFEPTFTLDPYARDVPERGRGTAHVRTVHPLGGAAGLVRRRPADAAALQGAAHQTRVRVSRPLDFGGSIRRMQMGGPTF